MKTCFVICPLSVPRSNIRKRSDRLLRLVIVPVLESRSYKVIRADQLHDGLTLSAAISKHIINDDLVVADLSDGNPNVFYELGKRHAWGGRTVHLTNNVKMLPFDLSHHRAIEYDIADARNLDQARKELNDAIDAVEQWPVQAPAELTPEKIISLSGASILLSAADGRRDHYYMAEDLAKRPCKSIFLMQRSSTLILGPEQGWPAEESFYNALLEKIKEGTRLFHIVSLEGISRHLSRMTSAFPSAQATLAKLHRTDHGVGIKVGRKAIFFKRIADEFSDVDLKPDRQARTFLVEYEDGEVEGVLVVDLGGRQSSFRFRGPVVRQFLKSCLEFYDQSPMLLWSDLEKIPRLQTKALEKREKRKR